MVSSIVFCTSLRHNGEDRRLPASETTGLSHNLA